MSKNLKLALGLLLLLGAIWGVQSFLKFHQSQSAASIKSQISTLSTKETKIQGILMVSHGDDFVNKISIPYYFIQQPDGKLIEITVNTKEEILEDKSGSTVSVTGTQVEGKIAINSLASIDFISSPPSNLKIVQPTSLPVTKKVAVILFNFQNDTSQTYSTVDAKKMIFTDSSTNPQSINGFFKEVSYGKIQLAGKIDPTGDVYGWYTIPSANTPCNTGSWATSADTLAGADGFNNSAYDSIVYIFPGTSACPWGGLSTGSNVPPPMRYLDFINGGWYGTIAHELGHSLFFFEHSNALECINQNGLITSISNDCKIKEYADPFDIMANATLKHFNNIKKKYINIFNSQQVLDVVQSGTYTLYSPETSVNRVQVIRIPIESNSVGDPIKYYYLELRRKYGTYDNFSLSDPVVNGVSIRVASNNYGQAYLVDTTPGSNVANDYADAPLKVGQTFTDMDRGIAITTSSITNNATGSSSNLDPKATINIVINGQPAGCVRMPPSFSGVVPISFQGYKGQTLTYKYTITNNDSLPCSSSVPSKFYIGVQGTSGLAMAPQYYFASIDPGISQTFYKNITIPCNAVSNGNIYTVAKSLSPIYYDKGVNSKNPFYPPSTQGLQTIPLTLISRPANSPDYCTINQ